MHSLTELQPVHRDEDRAIGLDLHEGVRRIDFWRGRRLACLLRMQRDIERERHDQAAGNGRGDTQKAAPAQQHIVGRMSCGCHGVPP